MNTDDDEPPTREELLRAREDIERQYDIVRTPARSSDRNPPLEAKLRAMLTEIDERLAAMDSANA